jgi:hypothetical protein
VPLWAGEAPAPPLERPPTVTDGTDQGNQESRIRL